MSRPPATSRKLRRVLVLLALFLVCEPEPKTGALNSVRGVPEQLQASIADGAGFAWSGGRALSKGPLEPRDSKSKAPSEKDQDEVEEATTEALQAKASFDQADWLDKTAEEIQSLGVEEVGSWVRAALEEASFDEEDEEVVQEITNTLKGEKINGAALLLLKSDDMKELKIPMGPRKVLASRIAAVSKATAKVESTLTDMALVVKAAVKEAMFTGLTVSRTALWKDAYGPDTKDQELRERTGEPVLDAKQLSSLTGQSTEKDLVAFTLPILRSLFPEDQIVDSQNCRWPGSGLSPDLFRCMVCNGNAASGTPYKEMLDCVSVFEAKLAIKDDSRGQLYEYLCRLPSKHARGMIFDKSGFELYHVAGQPGSRKALLERLCGAWSAPGGKKLLRDFLSHYSPWERLLRQSLRQAGAVPVAFLGSGAFGRVLEAQRERNEKIERIAIKAVLAAGVPDGFSPGAEVEVMKRALQAGCPVVAPSSDCIEVVEGAKVLGWFHILRDVGTPVPLDMAQARWPALVEALRQLHLNGFVHGDPRLANVVLLGENFTWIDFLGQPVFTGASQETDIQILMTDLVGQKDPVQFGPQFDGWPHSSAFIDNVLLPLMSSVTR